MFEKFMSSNAGDFRQRYHGTYGFYSRAGKRVLVKLYNVDTENLRVTFINKDNTPFVIQADASESEVGFEFLTPKAAWHNTPMGPLLVRRIAQRQYSRGLCESNTGITDATGVGKVVAFDTLGAIFDTTVTVAEASKGRSFALNEFFCVADERLWLLGQSVGKIERSGMDFSVTMDDKSLFGQEAQDAFSRAKIEATIQ